jgi:hypothetical protein
LSAESNRSKLLKTLGFVTGLSKRPPEVEEAELDPQMSLLRKWQSARLAHTHADLLESPRYGPACRFFLTDIYAPKDFSQRDQDIEEIYELMRALLPDFLLVMVRNAVEVNNLTNELDHDLLRALVDDLEVTDTITHELYAEAYRICDNYEERKYQIDLTVELGRQVQISTHIPLIATTIKLARGPARRAGWYELQSFIERGFKAFKNMGKAKLFLNTLQKREMAILDRIFERHPDPFFLEEDDQIPGTIDE